ncbi:hypothetical protein PsYK624_048880 [Phanerochaete sordida]|uniref:Uncharacterized protein n=1 Tax=Phanerochaete sordida TaxID=48140 RepID=A0A9P3G5W1_9APHY|nr:hypothetical protein PsYK624_048880 [Phanerochaete sordida]
MSPLAPINQNVQDSVFVFLLVEKDGAKPCEDLAWRLTWATSAHSSARHVLEFSDAKEPGVALSTSHDTLMSWLARHVGWSADLPGGTTRAWRLGSLRPAQFDVFLRLARETRVPESMRDVPVIRSRQFLPVVLWSMTCLRTMKKGIPALLALHVVEAAIREAVEMNI